MTVPAANAKVQLKKQAKKAGTDRDLVCCVKEGVVNTSPAGKSVADLAG